ncbi:MAG: serpin family protein [Candidatus Marinimicrobia bacterium]|nr:serpin family protein [Candidatus Neomarinimicrobiota bacterium]
MKKIIYLMLLIVFFSVSCAKKELSQKTQNTIIASPEIATGINQFGIDLLRQISGEYPENIFYSPFSISSALAMSYAGAEGNTADEMRKILYYGPQHPAFHAEYGNLIERLQSGEENNFTVHIANALWVQKNYTLKKHYLEVVKELYRSEAREMDFSGDAEGSRQTINNWVSEWTNERIRDLVPSGSIDALTRLILTNAVYFNAEWMEHFNEHMTRKEQFYPLKGDPYTVDMMYQRLHYQYSSGNSCDVLEIDYKGGEHSMLIFLPDKQKGLTSLIDKFRLSDIALHDSSKRPEDVILYMPKFRLETRYELAELLKALGMREAFSPQADFSGISAAKSKDLMISKVIHKAFIDVDEKKTEAAAATAVVMKMTAMPPAPRAPRVFRADHPFLFMIREKNNGTLLFLGCLATPEAK